jgi:hypothetical protein
MNRSGRPGHSFHFPRGTTVRAGSGAKSLMISMGHFYPDTGGSSGCPGNEIFDYFDYFGYCT